MCFTVLLATDSPTDLSLHNGQGVLFRPAEPDEARAANLPYPYVYDVAGTRFGTTAVSGSLQKTGKKPHKNSAKHYTCWTLSAASSETAPKCRLPAYGAATGRNCANPP